MIDKTEFAASTEEARYFLNGLYFSLTSELTKIVATDGRRLAVATSEALLSGEGEGDSIGVIVPLKAIKEIAKASGVSKKELDSLFTWVEDGWRWMARGRGILGVNLAGDEGLLD